MRCENETLAVARRMFPRETWKELEHNIFVANSRMPQNKTQKKIFTADVDMARILSKNGHTVCLLPENDDGRGSSGKHPDAVVDGMVMEFKRISGGVEILGKRFSKAIKQAPNVFLMIDTPLSIQAIYRKLHGEVVYHDCTDGKVFIYLAGKMYEWQISGIE